MTEEIGIVLETLFRDRLPLLFVQIVGRDRRVPFCIEVLAAGTDYEWTSVLSLSNVYRWWTNAHASDDTQERGMFWFDSDATKDLYLAWLTAAAL